MSSYKSFVDVYLPRNLDHNIPQGFALVYFSDKDDAQRSIDENCNLVIDKKSIKVGWPNQKTPFFSNHTGALGICNEPTEPPEIAKKEFKQSISLDSCMARNGYPWNSKRELKRLEPHAGIETIDMFSLKIENLSPTTK